VKPPQVPSVICISSPIREVPTWDHQALESPQESPTPGDYPIIYFFKPGFKMWWSQTLTISRGHLNGVPKTPLNKKTGPCHMGIPSYITQWEPGSENFRKHRPMSQRAMVRVKPWNLGSHSPDHPRVAY